MKLKCEVCGNSNIIKDNGVFVCQNCGVKYSLNELKSIFVDDSQKDNTPDQEMQKLYVLARLALNNQNTKEALDYYNQIYKLNPFQWEPMFYKGYLELSMSTQGNYSSNLVSFERYCKNAFQILRNQQLDKSTVSEIFELHFSKACEIIKNVATSYYKKLDNYNNDESTIKYYFDLVNATYPQSYNTLVRLGNSVSSFFSDNQFLAALFWKASIELNIQYLVFVKDKESALININKTYNVILGIDKNYKAPTYSSKYYATWIDYQSKLLSDSLHELWGKDVKK